MSVFWWLIWVFDASFCKVFKTVMWGLVSIQFVRLLSSCFRPFCFGTQDEFSLKGLCWCGWICMYSHPSTFVLCLRDIVKSGSWKRGINWVFAVCCENFAEWNLAGWVATVSANGFWFGQLWCSWQSELGLSPCLQCWSYWEKQDNARMHGLA